jgi:hypothetical protein
MRILTLCEGPYGERIVKHINKSGPQDWEIEVFSPPSPLPIVIDDPEEFLPREILQTDLLLALSESPKTAQLVPAIARLSGVKAVIMPVDNSSWLPLGLQNQIEAEIINMGVTAVFPKTFCTLTERTACFGEDIETYESKYVASFATHFGKPKLKIITDVKGEKIAGVEVERGAPCGSTHRVAEKLVGVTIKEAVPQASLYAFHYPCLASMTMEPTGDTLMHVSGYLVNEEVYWELQSYYRQKVVYPYGAQ